MNWRIGIDVGGTFTDAVAIDATGTTTVAKALTTPEDQSQGVLDALAELATRLGTPLAQLLANCRQIVHGTTVATNALLERKGARVGMLTTAGHRDVIEMHEGLKPARYDLRMPPAAPLIPRDLRLGVIERVGHDGRVITPLEETSLHIAIDQLRAAEVQAVAVCYLHAHRNPAHEDRTAELLAEALPGVHVSLSSQVLAQIKEYERFSTTAVNAYVGPALARYLGRLEGRLASVGFAGELFVILSHGGVAPLAEAARRGAATVLSGPAGGITGAAACARAMGLGEVLPFDMGGTSTEISLVEGGATALTSDRGVGGVRIALRSFDILSIGAGGGSLARSDPAGRFDVGPDSAGAWPGPVCYGRGGLVPTVTDANLMLGYIDADGFRGGLHRLDRAATEAAMAALAEAMGVPPVAAAEGIFRLINVKMADGFRLMTIRRGHDPRRFAILGFGGAAGIHATAVARELGVGRVIVPAMASVLSAWGMLASDLRYEQATSPMVEAERIDDATLADRLAELEARALRDCGFASALRGTLRIERMAEMRYGDQIFEIEVGLDDFDPAAPGLLAALVERFHERHTQLYSYANRDHPVEIVNLRVAVVAHVHGAGGLPLVNTADQGVARPPRPTRHRRIRLAAAWQEVPVHDHAALCPGQVLPGPTLVESENTSVLLQSGDTARVTDHGWLDIAVARDAPAA